MVHVDSNMSSISKADLASFFRDNDVWRYISKPEWVGFVQNNTDANDNVNGMNLTMGGGKISGVATPTAAESTSAVPKSYVDTGLGLKVDKADHDAAVQTLTANVKANKDAIDAVDATTTWADIDAPAWIGDVSRVGTDIKIKSNVHLDDKYVIGGLVAPTMPSQATTKKYVDDAIDDVAGTISQAADDAKQAAITAAGELITDAEGKLAEREWSDIKKSTIPEHIDYMFASSDISGGNKRTSLFYPLDANGQDIIGLPCTAATATSAVSKSHLEDALLAHTNTIEQFKLDTTNIYTKTEVNDAITALGSAESSLRTAITAEIGALDTANDWAAMIDKSKDGNGDPTYPGWIDLLQVTPGGDLAVEGTLDLVSNRLVNIAAPVNDSDAVNKAYVDSVRAPNVPTEAAQQVSLIENIKAAIAPEIAIVSAVAEDPDVPKSYDITLSAETSTGARQAANDYDMTSIDTVLTAYKTPTGLDGNPIESAATLIGSKRIVMAKDSDAEAGKYKFDGSVRWDGMVYGDSDIVTFRATPITLGKRTLDGAPVAGALESAKADIKFALQQFQVGAAIVPLSSGGSNIASA